MIVFKKKGEELYLITNYKVLYSTLVRQKDIIEFTTSKIFIIRLILNSLHLNKLQIYLLVRNPYEKLESFFKDKFRQSVKETEQKGIWQLSHRIFFPLLNINSNTSPYRISEKIMGVSFKEFISFLPKVYYKDKHLIPQHWAKTLKIKKIFEFDIPIRFVDIIHMESKIEMDNLSKLFKIDLNIRANSTKSIRVETEWGEKEKQTVIDIYKNDFEYFNYNY